MTPLVLFAYNRPDKLSLVLAALAAQTRRPSQVTAFLDGPPHQPGVRQCRTLLARHGCEVVERSENSGCARNISAGLSEAVSRFERFAVLEDDTVPGAFWYETMCLLLDAYADDGSVAAVGGYPSIRAGHFAARPEDVIFIPRFSCWGWATWSHKIAKSVQEALTGELDWNPAALPGHAGHDIGPMILQHPPLTIWDGVIAGSFLAHGLYQAVTKYHLVENVGAASLSPHQAAIMAENAIVDKLPASWPAAYHHDPEVCAAVCDYVRLMG